MSQYHKPVRVFEGSAEPYKPFWTVRNAASSDGGEPEIDFYGYISEFSWFEDDITPKLFKEDLYSAGLGGPVTVRINSGGGEVFAASVIKSIITEYPGRVTMRVDGLAASAATIVLMAGDVIKAQDSAYIMIHDPEVMVLGTEHELKSALDLLKTIKLGIVDGYVNRTGLNSEKLSKMMSSETWMTAQQAKELGFVDEVIVGPDKNFDDYRQPAFLNALSLYRSVPAELWLAINKVESPAEPVTSEPMLTEDILQKVEDLRDKVCKILSKEKTNA